VAGKNLFGAMADELVVSVIGPSLKAAGFRKNRRTWWREDDESRCSVGYRGSVSGSPIGESTLFIGVGASFERLGHERSLPPGWEYEGLEFRLERLRIESGERLTWNLPDVGDSDGIAEFRAALEAEWTDFGLPLALATATPEALAAHIARTGNTETVQTVVDRVVRPLGDEHLLRSLAQRGLVAARCRRQWRYLKDDSHPLELGLRYWEWILRLADDVGVTVSEADLLAAGRVLADAASGTLMTIWHSGSEETAARYLGNRLDVALPTFAPMTHNAAL
jgi:hypothetical protein